MPHPAIFGPIGQPFVILPSVESTNNYAMGLVQAGMASHGAAFFALEQTAGKGQRGKKWIAEPHKNIALSIVLEPGFLQAHQQFLLSATVALAAYDVFEKYAGNDTRIKWPNDIYWRDRKAGGILIENSFRGNDWQYAIAGIGININQTRFDDSVKHAVSLQQVTGRPFLITDLAKELCAFLEQRFGNLLHIPYSHILLQYQQVLYKLQQPVKLKKDNAVFETTIRGVSATGQLLTSGSADQVFDFGEVEWVIEY